MSNSGYHAAEDGSLARSTGGAAARGAMLIALALVIGLLLVMFALDDPQTELAAGDTEAAAETAEGEDTTASDGTGDGTAEADDVSAAPSVGEPSEEATADGTAEGTAETIPPIEEDGIATDTAVEPGVLVPANEVTVLVANGRGTAGVAGGVQDVLVADGYTAVVSNAPATASGVIFYRPGYDANARAVGEALGAAPDAILPAPDSISVDPAAISDGRLADANIIVIIGSDESVPPA